MAEEENRAESSENEEKNTENEEKAVEKKEEATSSENKGELGTVLNKVGKKDEKVNAFYAVSLLLKHMREQLEGAKELGSLPRWARVARIAKYREQPIGKVVVILADNFVKVVGILAELTLKAKELLEQIDSGKALLEVGADMVKTVASDEFMVSVQKSVGIKNAQGIPGSAEIIKGVDTAMEIMDYIPDPKDIELVSQELYKLLSVGNVDMYDAPQCVPGYENTTGVVRLMSWALDTKMVFHGLTASKGVEVSKLGIYRQESQQDQAFLLGWKQEKDKSDTVEESEESEEKTEDTEILEFRKIQYADYGPAVAQAEAQAVLTKLGYTGDYATSLKEFQELNKLDQSGVLDLPTINQLMNMDYENKTLSRAKAKPAVTSSGLE